MLEVEKAAVDVGASAAAEQRSAIMSCSVPLQCDSLVNILQEKWPRVNELFTQGGETVAKRKNMRVAPLLKRGAENALSTPALMQALGFRDRRQLRTLLERERDEGVLILSTCRGGGGYFLPSDDPTRAREELAAFVHTIRSRALNSLHILRNARRALRECEGQLAINDSGGERSEQKSD